MHIGHIPLANRLFVAPMAGVTDRPFRQLCKQLGAGYAVSEMVTSRKDLWNSLKTSRRADHAGEPGPIAVQIAGTDAPMMAAAAVYNVERGAQIIDINMGCPAKKVCNKWAGSALMQNEALAVEIAAAVVQACAPHNVPVTLKMRTGWCQQHKNAVSLARQFEAVGIQMLTAALIGLAVAPLSGGFLRGTLTAKALWAVGYLALFGSLLAFSAYIYLAKAWPPAKMGTYAYLNPLVAVLLGSLILHEAFGLREILGMTIILAAVALVQLRQTPTTGKLPSES